jgi:hypothetical protein
MSSTIDGVPAGWSPTPQKALAMVHSISTRINRFFHPATHDTPTTQTAPPAFVAVVGSPRTERERFIADLRQSVIELDERGLRNLIENGPADQVQDAVNAVIPMGPRHVQPGDSPLHFLASRHLHSARAARMMSLLLKHGADPAAQNEGGATPGMRAIDKRQGLQLAVLADWLRHGIRAPSSTTQATNFVFPSTLDSLIAYADQTYRFGAAEILERPWPLAAPGSSRRLAPRQDEAIEQTRAAACWLNAAPPYTPPTPPPSYSRFMQSAMPPAHTPDAPRRPSTSDDVSTQRSASDR